MYIHMPISYFLLLLFINIKYIMDRQFNSFHYYNNHYNKSKLMNILFSCFTLFSDGGVLSESDWLRGFSHSSQALIIHFYLFLC